MIDIQQRLKTIFQAQRLVFWYDDNEALRDEFEAIDLDDVTKLVIDNNEFGIKRQLLSLQPNNKFFIYSPNKAPRDEENWLLDLNIANYMFAADKTSLILQNLGLMRIPIEVAIKGGDSDCRNRTLHKMFMLIGYGERAGSGIPKIYSGWNSQDWTKPLLYEKAEPEQTLLELRMINLLDTDIIEELKEIYQDSLNDLSKDEMTVLTTAYIEEGTNHKRILELLDLHPSDISNLLRKLVDDDFLVSDGIGRGTIYQAMGLKEIAGGVNNLAGGVSKITGGVNAFYEVSDIPEDFHTKITSLTDTISNKQRIKKEVMQGIIIDICSYGYFSPELLSQLLGKGKDWIKEFISELSKTDKLKKLYEVPNHPKQAYTKIEEQI